MEVEYYSYSEEPESVALYEMVKGWSPERFPIPELLPKMGVLVKEGGEYLAFVCADMSNNIPRAQIDYLMTNPAAGWRRRHKAVKMGEKFICERLKENGFSVVQAITPHAGIASLACLLGYSPDPVPQFAIYKTL